MKVSSSDRFEFASRLVTRFETLVEKVERLRDTKEKIGFVRYKPLFSDYNSCIREFKTSFPSEFETLDLEELPLYNEEGKEQFTLNKVSTLLHQSKSIIGVLKPLLPSQDNGIKLPKTVTLKWLYEYVPMKFWIWLAVVIFSSFVLGVTLGQISWVQEVSNRIRGTVLPKTESDTERPYIETKKPDLKDIDLDIAIKHVTKFRDRIQTIRDLMNAGKYKISQQELHGLRKDYETDVRPYIEALGMREPGEKDLHGYKLTYESPIDLALQEFSFFHLNLSLRFLSTALGRLENLKQHSRKDHLP